MGSQRRIQLGCPSLEIEWLPAFRMAREQRPVHDRCRVDRQFEMRRDRVETSVEIIRQPFTVDRFSARSADCPARPRQETVNRQPGAGGKLEIGLFEIIAVCEPKIDHSRVTQADE